MWETTPLSQLPWEFQIVFIHPHNNPNNVWGLSSQPIINTEEEAGEPVLSYKYLHFTEEHQGAWNSLPYQFPKLKAHFVLAPSWKVTDFSKHRSQKAQQERAAEASSSKSKLKCHTY